MEYEICYLIGESKELNLDSIKEGVEKIVENAGGSFLEGEFQEKRKMAYEIEKEIRGTYVARRFEVKKVNGAVDEITKELNLNNDVLRFIVVKTDELPELRKSELETKTEESFDKTQDKKEEVKEVKKEESKKEVRKEEVKKEESKKKEVKEEEVKKEELKKEGKKEKKTKSKEEFDKKLDEILNI